MKYLARSVNDQYLFDKNEFQFNFGNTDVPLHLVYRYHQREKLEQEELLAQLIIHTSGYEIYNTVWGKEYVSFTDEDTPEKYKVTSTNNIVSLSVKYPKHIKAVYAAPDNDNILYGDLENITDRLKIKNSQIFFPWTKSKKIQIFILRQIDGWFDMKLNIHYNHISSQFWHDYLNFYSTELGYYTRYFKGWFFTDFKNNCNTSYIPLTNKFDEFLKKEYGSDPYKVLLTYWHEFQDINNDINYIVNKYYLSKLEKVFKNEILSNYSLHNKEMYFFINEESYCKNHFRRIQGLPAVLTKILPHTGLILNSNLLHANDIYRKEKEIEIKLVNSLIHQYGKEDVIIHSNELLNFRGSFEKKMWQIHWLISLGITKFNLSIENPPGEARHDFFNNIPTEDPCYPVYPDWFAYINQLSHFLKSGIHRADILILFPEESMWFEKTNNLIEIINMLNNNALDYDFTDFDTFTSTERCIIDKDKIYIHQEVYSFLIIPGIDRIPLKTLKRIQGFYDAGGIVIALGKIASLAFESDNNDLINQLTDDIWFKESSLSSTKFKKNQNGGKGYFQSNTKNLPDIIYSNKEKLNFTVRSEQNTIRSLVRELPDCYHIFIFNSSDTDVGNGVISSKYKGLPYCWNFQTVEPEQFYNWYARENFIHIPFIIPPKQVKLFLLKKENVVEHVQIIQNDLYYTGNLHMDQSSIQLEGLVKKEGSYNITFQYKSKSKKLKINLKEHAPVLKISDNNWNINFNYKKITGTLGDLSLIDPFYSGQITYKKIIVIPKNYFNNYKLILDLGKLCDWVFVKINNKEIGTTLLPPFECDITKFVKEGENLLHFELYNSLTNRFAQLPGALKKNILVNEYGLFGPVKIIPYKKVKIDYKFE